MFIHAEYIFVSALATWDSLFYHSNVNLNGRNIRSSVSIQKHYVGFFPFVTLFHEILIFILFFPESILYIFVETEDFLRPSEE